MKELIEIKRAEITDAHLLMSISIETFRAAYSAYNTSENMAAFIGSNFNLHTLKQELTDNGNTFFFIYVNDTLAGYCKLRSSLAPQALEITRAMELERLYILQTYQKKNAGGVLMQHCIDHAILNGYEVLWLGVWEHNPHAIRFYKKWGYSRFGEHIFMLGNDVQTDVLMKRIL